MRKNVIISILISFIAMLSACQTSSSKSFEFTIDNGDSVKLTMDTSDGYDLSADVPFEISHKGEVLSFGTFIYAEAYEAYKEIIEEDENAILLDSGSKNGHEYFFWTYDEEEFNYAILLKETDTGIILANAISEETARECFERLTIGN